MSQKKNVSAAGHDKEHRILISSDPLRKPVSLIKRVPKFHKKGPKIAKGDSFLDFSSDRQFASNRLRWLTSEVDSGIYAAAMQRILAMDMAMSSAIFKTFGPVPAAACV